MGILDGKVAIVTGSGQGVGFEIAKGLAAEGCKVITNNRKPGSALIAFEKSTLEPNEEERKKLKSVTGDAKTAADYIISQGGEATPFFGDMGDPEVSKACVQTAIDTYGRIDIVINNAYSSWVGSIERMEAEEWFTVVNTKLNAAFYLVKNALPYMKEQKFGRIINAASDGWLGLQGMSAYGAACAGMWSFTRAIAQDLKGTGITANSYTPNAKTRSWYSSLVNYRTQGVPAEVIEQVAPESMKYTADIFAPFFAYLCSDYASDITGYMFKTGADGQLGIWSEPTVINDIWHEKGQPWPMERLINEVHNMLVSKQESGLELH